MENKYEGPVLNALRDGMREVSQQFMDYYAAGAGQISGGSSGQGTGADASEEWKPERWDYEVCCMEGMPCWTGDFANAAGRGAIEAEIEWREKDLVK